MLFRQVNSSLFSNQASYKCRIREPSRDTLVNAFFPTCNAISQPEGPTKIVTATCTYAWVLVQHAFVQMTIMPEDGLGNSKEEKKKAPSLLKMIARIRCGIMAHVALFLASVAVVAVVICHCWFSCHS